MNVKRREAKRNGVFLVVVDTTDECFLAVDYASQFANAEHGYVALLNVMEQLHVQNWKTIEDRVRRDMRVKSEQMIWEAAGRVLKDTGNIPMVCIEEGESIELILDTIEKNENIVALVLASSGHSSNPGPLVSYFSGKGLHRLVVPLMIVPGHLADSMS